MHSDDFDYENVCVLKIIQEKDIFKIVFEKSKTTDRSSYSIRIGNTDGRYNPFDQ